MKIETIQKDKKQNIKDNENQNIKKKNNFDEIFKKKY